MDQFFLLNHHVGPMVLCSAMLFGKKEDKKKGLTMSKKFANALDRASDPTLLEPNWDATLECVDLIRAAEMGSKDAVAMIRKKTLVDNPHASFHALIVLDACVKNCGSKVHHEVATKECMEEFRDLVLSKHEKVREKAAEMLQCWAMAFVREPAYKIIVDTHNLLKLTGVQFPPMKDPESMYIAQVAPEWVDGNKCFRCRTEFSLFTRKHHCRACGQIFCDKCSSRQMELPLLGIEKPVRVCDACYEKGPNAGRNARAEEKDSGAQAAADNKERQLKEKEEEELALALAISQSEAEAKEREKKMYSIYNGEGRQDDSSSVAPSEVGYRGTAPSVETELSVASDDPLAKYLNRDYWQKKTATNNKVEEWEVPLGAPPPSDFSTPAPELTPLPVIPPSNDQSALETAAFTEHLNGEVTIIDSRIRSNIARGRSIVNDSTISALFDKLTSWHGEVLDRMARLDEQRAHLEGLQDHLAHIGEARAAMEALREEHARRQREDEEERRRVKAAAMNMKLQMMRQKKHEMLLNQRHIALHRFQQNEMAHRMGGQPPMPPYSQTVYAPEMPPLHYHPQVPMGGRLEGNEALAPPHSVMASLHLSNIPPNVVPHSAQYAPQPMSSQTVYSAVPNYGQPQPQLLKWRGRDGVYGRGPDWGDRCRDMERGEKVQGAEANGMMNGSHAEAVALPPQEAKDEGNLLISFD